jgi:hypothetical protein
VVLIGVALGAVGCSSSGASSSGGKPHVGPPTGTVTVRSGNKVVCVITLDQSGKGTCKVSTAGYAAGKVTYTGTYNGGTGYLPGAKSSTTQTILPAKPAGPVASSAGPVST